MSVEWPAALPLPQFGLRYNVADPQMRTLMASGRTISRRRFSDVPTEFSARWMLRQGEAEIFEQFYQNDAVDGSEWIEMPLVTPQGEDVNYVRFRGAYQYRRVGADLWEYTANLQMYLRPGSPEWPPVPGATPVPPGIPPNTIDVTDPEEWSWIITTGDGEGYEINSWENGGLKTTGGTSEQQRSLALRSPPLLSLYASAPKKVHVIYEWTSPSTRFGKHTGDAAIAGANIGQLYFYDNGNSEEWGMVSADIGPLAPESYINVRIFDIAHQAPNRLTGPMAIVFIGFEF